MPAEWETHAATWLAWPHEKTDWPGKFAPIPWVYADIVRHLSQVERVRILVANAGEERAVRGILKKAGANLSGVDFCRVSVLGRITKFVRISFIWASYSFSELIDSQPKSDA